MLHAPRGSLPDTFDIGGIMARKSNLSAVLSYMRDFVDNPKNGFILVSFGTWLDRLPDEILYKLADAF